MFPKGEMCGVGRNESVRIRIKLCHVMVKEKKNIENGLGVKGQGVIRVMLSRWGQWVKGLRVVERQILLWRMEWRMKG